MGRMEYESADLPLSRLPDWAEGFAGWRSSQVCAMELMVIPGQVELSSALWQSSNGKGLWRRGGMYVCVCVPCFWRLESLLCVCEQMRMCSYWAEASGLVSNCQMADKHTDLFFISGSGLRQQWCETLWRWSGDGCLSLPIAGHSTSVPVPRSTWEI